MNAMGSVRRLRAVGLAGFAGLATLALSGCGGPAPVACPAIFYTSTLTIHVVGQPPADIVLCDDGLCAPSASASAAGFIVTPAVVNGNAWTFSGHFRDELTVRLLDDDEVIAEVPIDPTWRRTGGSPECGGPAVAEVTVRL